MRQGGEDKTGAKGGSLKQKLEEPCCPACFQTLVGGISHVTQAHMTRFGSSSIT